MRHLLPQLPTPLRRAITTAAAWLDIATCKALLWILTEAWPALQRTYARTKPHAATAARETAGFAASRVERLNKRTQAAYTAGTQRYFADLVAHPHSYENPGSTDLVCSRCGEWNPAAVTRTGTGRRGIAIVA